MDGELGRLAATQGGFVYRYQALDHGYRDTELRGLVRSGAWVTLRRGAYAERAVVDRLDLSGRHALLARAVIGRLEGQVVAAGVTSLALQEVPIWGVDPQQVHVYRDGGHSARTDAGVVHHRAALDADDVVDLSGVLGCRAERSVVDAARRTGFEPAVVLADGAARLLPYDPAVAADIVERQRDWPGSLVAGRAVRFADGAAETVGESRSRVLISRVGLPKPYLQRVFRRDDGAVFARVDFWFEDFCTVGEFDGKQKYGRSFYEKTGRIEDVDVAEVLWAEKRREDEIRDGGNECVRWVWHELQGHDAVVLGRFERAFARQRRRRLA